MILWSYDAKTVSYVHHRCRTHHAIPNTKHRLKIKSKSKTRQYVVITMPDVAIAYSVAARKTVTVAKLIYKIAAALCASEASTDLGLKVMWTGLSGVITVFSTGFSSSPSYSNSKLATIYSKTSKSVELTQAYCCAPGELLFCYRWLHLRFNRSRLFKIIEFCTNRKPTCDLLLITCDLSFISHHFRDIAPQSLKPPPPYFEPSIKRIPSNFVVKLTIRKAEAFSYFSAKKRFSYFVTIHCHHRPTTTENTVWHNYSLRLEDRLSLCTW